MASCCYTTIIVELGRKWYCQRNGKEDAKSVQFSDSDRATVNARMGEREIERDRENHNDKTESDFS